MFVSNLLLERIQDVVYQPVTPLGALAAALLVPVIAWLSSKIYDGVKTAFPWYDNLPSIVHQVAAPLFGLGFGYLSTALGVELLTDFNGITAGFIGAVLNSLAMAGIKRWEKQNNPVDATVALELSRKAAVPVSLRAPRVRRTRTPVSGQTGHPDGIRRGPGETLRGPGETVRGPDAQ